VDRSAGPKAANPAANGGSTPLCALSLEVAAGIDQFRRLGPENSTFPQVQVHLNLTMRGVRLTVLVAAVAMGALVARPDTIVQTNSEGRQVVVQQHAIVVNENQYAITYKHFDLKQRRVVKVELNQGSLPYRAVTSSPAERHAIVKVWEEFGYTATITTRAGKTSQIYDTYVDFFPPAGVGSFIATVPARTNLPILFDNGGADEIEFSQISNIDFSAGHLKVTLTNGTIRTGKFLMPTSEPAVAHFMGITNHYDPASPEVYDFSIPLSEIAKIRFDNDP
jgi:hypothetical protein